MGFGFPCQGLGFRVQGLGLRVLGSGLGMGCIAEHRYGVHRSAYRDIRAYRGLCTYGCMQMCVYVYTHM